MSDKPVKYQKVADLLSREVSRAEFLRYSGVAMLSMVGIFNFIKNLHEIVPEKKQTTNSTPSKKGGYGGSAYGG